MKLYATVTSERASKSQGGQEYLYIKIQGAEPSVASLLDIEIVPSENGRAKVKNILVSQDMRKSLLMALGICPCGQLKPKHEHIHCSNELKGEQQKGEHVHDWDNYGKCVDCNQWRTE